MIKVFCMVPTCLHHVGQPPTLECIRRWGVVEPQIYITLVVNPYSMCVAAVFESFFRKLHKRI